MGLNDEICRVNRILTAVDREISRLGKVSTAFGDADAHAGYAVHSISGINSDIALVEIYMRDRAVREDDLLENGKLCLRNGDMAYFRYYTEEFRAEQYV